MSTRLEELLRKVDDRVAPPAGGSSALSLRDYQRAADTLQVGVHHIQAFAEVEAGVHGAFLPSGDPVMLFERHVFSRRTNGRFDDDHPHISNARPGGYGKVLAQAGRFALAVRLNRSAAIMATSWGLFQILGENYGLVGYDRTSRFELAMRRSAGDHLKAFVRYVQATGLADALRRGDWRAVAKGYNGPGYAAHGYHTRIEAAFNRLSRGTP